MKRTVLNFISIIVGVVFSTTLMAQQAYQIKSQSIVVSGTSNLHDWTATPEKVLGNFKVGVNGGKITSINAIDLKVDSKSLKGSKGSIMNSKIEDALDAKKNPFILFRSNAGTVTENSGTYKVTTSGVLTIAGTSQNVTIEALGKVLPGGEIEFTGKKKLKMTDYKIDPPTAMFGTLTTGDEVTLTFKVVLKTV